jgi:hypothetical protein
LVVLKRRLTTPEDDKLGNDILLAVRGSLLVKVWEEPVNIKKGSSRLSAEGLFDYDQDGILDIEVKVIRPEGTGTAVLHGTKTGWTVLEIPDILP